MSVAEKNSTAEALRAEMAPSGVLQRFLVDQMAQAMDRLTRAAALEDSDEPDALRFQAQAERTFYKALAEFRRQVKAAAQVEEPTPTPAATVAAVPPLPSGRPVAILPPSPQGRAEGPCAHRRGSPSGIEGESHRWRTRNGGPPSDGGPGAAGP